MKPSFVRETLECVLFRGGASHTQSSSPFKGHLKLADPTGATKHETGLIKSHKLFRLHPNAVRPQAAFPFD